MTRCFLQVAMIVLGTSAALAQPLTPGPPRRPAPTQGSESFTRDEASHRFAAGGFSDVRSLMKDGRGVWHARARQHGQAIDIWLDTKGHVSTAAP